MGCHGAATPCVAASEKWARLPDKPPVGHGSVVPDSLCVARLACDTQAKCGPSVIAGGAVDATYMYHTSTLQLTLVQRNIWTAC